MNENHQLADRVTKLEELVTFMQQTTNELNEEVVRLSRQTDAQEARLSRLVASLDSVSNRVAELGSADDEKPPHY